MTTSSSKIPWNRRERLGSSLSFCRFKEPTISKTDFERPSSDVLMQFSPVVRRGFLMLNADRWLALQCRVAYPRFTELQIGWNSEVSCPMRPTVFTCGDAQQSS